MEETIKIRPLRLSAKAPPVGDEPRLVSITRDQFAIRALITRGLAVTLAGQLLADAFDNTALRPIDATAPECDVYALLPPGSIHTLTTPSPPSPGPPRNSSTLDDCPPTAPILPS